MGAKYETAGGRRLWSIVLLAMMMTMGGLLSASPASAHGGGETEEGYLLVQQALGHLAHDSSMAGMDVAMEKVNDALTTKDQEGVAVAEVKQAKAALEAGQAKQGQALLQHSILGALSELKPAVGEETGTTVVLSPMQGRNSLTAGTWGLLIGSVLLLFAGVGLAWRFRPQDSVHELRRRFDSARVPLTVRPETLSKDAS